MTIGPGMDPEFDRDFALGENAELHDLIAQLQDENKRLQSELNALSRAPEGWVLVPREPTDEVIEQCEPEVERTKHMKPDLIVYAIWKALLSAILEGK